MPIAHTSPSRTAKLYKLLVTKAEKGLGFPDYTTVEAPLTKSKMLKRVQQIIDCKPAADGSVAHGAVVRLLDTASQSVIWERQVGVDLNRMTKLVAPPLTKKTDQRQAVASSASLVNLKSPIVGFRSWAFNVPSLLVGEEIIDGEPQLFGPHFYGRSEYWEWKDAELRAQCLDHTHRAPVLACECGVYAYHDHWLRNDLVLTSLGGYVDGAILGTGDVFIHHDGWRAEFGRIIGFAPDGVDARFLPALQQLARKFDVPVVPRSDLYALACSKGRVMRKEALEKGSAGDLEVG